MTISTKQLLCTTPTWGPTRIRHRPGALLYGVELPVHQCRRGRQLNAHGAPLSGFSKNWFKRLGSDYDTQKPSLFSINSRIFEGANWLPNTTRGTKNYLHCTHAIYLYEQNVIPILLQWLDANNAEFRAAYALTEIVQWLWRSQLRRGKAVDVYMPSNKMREIIQRWLLDEE